GRGLPVWEAFPVAGDEIDLLVEQNGRALGVDLIGYPGAFASALGLDRYRMLHRAGLALFPLPYSSWQEDRARCLRALLERFEEQQLETGTKDQ
ncbi:MAG TPA: hypothetical protein VE964_08210, partial [Myxococcales bacterium]|nr:hypothetical protein [Myxococcales bacterium]